MMENIFLKSFKTFLPDSLFEKCKEYVIGWGSFMDLSGEYYEVSKSSIDKILSAKNNSGKLAKIEDDQQDWMATYSDWYAVGCDINKSLEKHLPELKEADSALYERTKQKLEQSSCLG